MYCQKAVTVRVQKQGKGTTDITDLIGRIKEISKIKIGLCHVFIKHTSASVCIGTQKIDDDIDNNSDWNNKNVLNLKQKLNEMVPERRDYIHNYEGNDDMPAHGKCVIIGSEFTVPITNGKLNLHSKQRLYLVEHRYHMQSRKLIVTLRGRFFEFV